MRLADVMGAADLSWYAQVGLVAFFCIFVALALRVFLLRDPDLEHVRLLPLEEDDSPDPHTPRTRPEELSNERDR